MQTYQITIPEYKLKTFKKTSKKIDYPGTPWFNLKIPKVYYDNQPNFEKIGNKIDKCLKKHFLNKKVAIRVLGSEEHRGKSINKIIKIILIIKIIIFKSATTFNINHVAI